MSKKTTTNVVSLKKGGKPAGLPRKQTYTIKSPGVVHARVLDFNLAVWMASGYFQHLRSVSIYDNTARKTVAHYIYGHRQ